eukprot:Platyproteum_vivax@DN1814_c0_g1_i2.p1
MEKTVVTGETSGNKTAEEQLKSKNFPHLAKMLKLQNILDSKKRPANQMDGSVYNKWLLKFHNSSFEQKFAESSMSSHLEVSAAMAIVTGSWIIQCVALLTMPDPFDRTVNYPASIVIGVIFGVIFLILTMVWLFKAHFCLPKLFGTYRGTKWLYTMTLIYYFGAFIVSLGKPQWFFIHPNNEKAIFSWATMLDVIFWLIVVNFNSGLNFRSLIVINVLLQVVSYLPAYMGYSLSEDVQTVDVFYYTVLTSIVCLHAYYYKELFDRQAFFLKEQSNSLQKKATSLLNEMLPIQILEELQSDCIQIAYQYRQMTLLYSDICGFTAFANSVEPHHVVELLTSLFHHFDNLTTALGIYKVCTIGDAYVAEMLTCF